MLYSEIAGLLQFLEDSLANKFPGSKNLGNGQLCPGYPRAYWAHIHINLAWLNKLRYRLRQSLLLPDAVFICASETTTH